MLLALGLAMWGLGTILSDRAWWLVAMLVALIVMLSAAVVRQFSSKQLLSSGVASVVALLTLTSFFAQESAVFSIIPTLDTLNAFARLEMQGGESIATQSVPANAGVGIVFLLCVGTAIIAVLMDAAAHLFRSPALAGIPLLALLLVPTSVRADLGDPWTFALVAAAYLVILLVRSTPTGRRAALGISATALAGSLVLPLVLPSVEPLENLTTSSVFAAGINPIVTLGNDLRRANEMVALTYTTSTSQGQYLRLTALDDFNGRSWKPSNTNVVDSNTVDAIDLPVGLDASTPVLQVSTEVEVGNVRSRWLPVPYAPSQISGLKGDWAWEPDALAIRTERSNVSGQTYTVASVEATPSVEQLMAAPQDFDESFARYLELPNNLPQIVRTTATDVAGAAATDYEAAIALQDYFRGGEFEYSEETPVKENYDGSGAEALKDFLEVKAGYCVHFSSAMAAMARSLDIPARVAVGFTPGSKAIDPESQQTVYTVTTYNLHAWPELYFSGVGWVRFEPTPGRGELPSFAPLSQDDPSTPDVDESVPQAVPTSSASAPPVSTPTTAPSGGPLAPEPTDPTGTGATGATAAGTTPWTGIVFAVVLAVLLTPCIIRLVQRRRRFGLVESGAALAAWDEIYDTVDDLGMRLVDGLTPRQAAALVAEYVDDSAAGALLRLARALETDAYAERPGEPDPNDLREVLRSLRREAGSGRSLRAALLPISLVRNWLPQAPKYEVH